MDKVSTYLTSTPSYIAKIHIIHAELRFSERIDSFGEFHQVSRSGTYLKKVRAIRESTHAQYNALSMTGGMGLISVPSSCSILYRLKRSSYVMRLIARPR